MRAAMWCGERRKKTAGQGAATKARARGAVARAEHGREVKKKSGAQRKGDGRRTGGSKARKSKGGSGEENGKRRRRGEWAKVTVVIATAEMAGVAVAEAMRDMERGSWWGRRERCGGSRGGDGERNRKRVAVGAASRARGRGMRCAQRRGDQLVGRKRRSARAPKTSDGAHSGTNKGERKRAEKEKLEGKCREGAGEDRTKAGAGRRLQRERVSAWERGSVGEWAWVRAEARGRRWETMRRGWRGSKAVCTLP